MDKPRKIPLDWRVPDGMQIVFANHMLVTDIHDQVIVTFFQMQPPVVLDGQESKWDEIKSVPATAVARLAIPPKQLPSMIGALQTRYDAWMASKEEGRDTEESGK